MEVEIISKELIKPCSSTPSHLKSYKATIFDQFMTHVFYSIALYYPNNNPAFIPQNTSLVLKHSLSKILSHFYPLAGRIKDYASIDCNDEGVYYTNAKANISMSEYLIQLDLSLLPKLVPDVSFFNQNPIGAPLIFIQETTFSCGGLVIGLSVSHMALDGPSLAYFIKSWSSAAVSSNENIPYPNLDSRSLFPMYEHGDFPKEAVIASLSAPFIVKEKFSLNRLVFDASAVRKLKSKAASSSGVEHPTRVEVVSAIISKSVKAALNAKSDIKKRIAISQVVNMRRKAMPPFSDSSLGNFIWPTLAINTEEETEFSSLVYNLRDAIRKVDSEFVKNAIEGGSSKFLRDLKETRDSLSVDEMEFMMFTSWCNFGMYNNSNFGFGKPTWISLCIMTSEEIIPCNNICMLKDTMNGDGVEAWLFVPQDIVAVLEKDDELLQYASFNISPLNIS